MDTGIQAWLDGGASPHKLNLGIATYGRGFTLANPNNISLNAPAMGGSEPGPYTNERGLLGFNEIQEEPFRTWPSYWEPEQRVPYIVQANQWIGFENEQSVAEKARFARTKNLGGVMIWSLDTDDFHAGYPLLNAIRRNM